jgi:hypothetical protein
MKRVTRSAHTSGTGVKISSSSSSISASDLAFAVSSSERGGSHDAISRWLLARATLALLRITSTPFVEAGMIKSSEGVFGERNNWKSKLGKISALAARRSAGSFYSGYTLKFRVQEAWQDMSNTRTGKYLRHT